MFPVHLFQQLLFVKKLKPDFLSLLSALTTHYDGITISQSCIPTSEFAGTTDLSDASHFSTALGQVIAFDPATTVMKVFTWETPGLHFFITLILALVIMSIGYHGKHGRWSIEM